MDAGAKARHRTGQDPRPAHLVHRRPLVGPPPAWALRGERGYLVKTADEAREAVRKKKAAGIEIIKFNEYVAPEVIKAGAEEANKLGMPITCHCLDVFLAAENNFAGVEHHWGMGMTTIGDVKKRWEVHERRMTRKINTADLAYYYEPENFDKVVKAAVEKNISWSPTIATWYRPLVAQRGALQRTRDVDTRSEKCRLLAARPARASARPIRTLRQIRPRAASPSPGRL